MAMKISARIEPGVGKVEERFTIVIEGTDTDGDLTVELWELDQWKTNAGQTICEVGNLKDDLLAVFTGKLEKNVFTPSKVEVKWKEILADWLRRYPQLTCSDPSSLKLLSRAGPYDYKPAVVKVGFKGNDKTFEIPNVTELKEVDGESGNLADQEYEGERDSLELGICLKRGGEEVLPKSKWPAFVMLPVKPRVYGIVDGSEPDRGNYAAGRGPLKDELKKTFAEFGLRTVDGRDGATNIVNLKIGLNRYRHEPGKGAHGIPGLTPDARGDYVSGTVMAEAVDYAAWQVDASSFMLVGKNRLRTKWMEAQEEKRLLGELGVESVEGLATHTYPVEQKLKELHGLLDAHEKQLHAYDSRFYCGYHLGPFGIWSHSTFVAVFECRLLRAQYHLNKCFVEVKALEKNTVALVGAQQKISDLLLEIQQAFYVKREVQDRAREFVKVVSRGFSSTGVEEIQDAVKSALRVDRPGSMENWVCNEGQIDVTLVAKSAIQAGLGRVPPAAEMAQMIRGRLPAQQRFENIKATGDKDVVKFMRGGWLPIGEGQSGDEGILIAREAGRLCALKLIHDMKMRGLVEVKKEENLTWDRVWDGIREMGF